VSSWNPKSLSVEDRVIIAETMKKHTILLALSYDKSARVRRAVAENPATASAILKRLLKDEGQWVAIRAAANPSLGADHIRDAFLNIDSRDVRLGIARNPSCPSDILSTLAVAPDWAVMSCVAQNPNTPPDLLAELAKSDSWGVRSSVAENPKTPLETLERLADEYPSQILDNPSSPDSIKAELLLLNQGG
jgi:hypothetical protein